MYVAVGQPSTVAYKSIAQSKRWNRQPIPTGSSDYDKHVGGGVSLTATSDHDDKVQVSTCRYPTNNTDEKPATPPGHLRADSKSSRSNEQTDPSVGSMSIETSPSSIDSADLKNSVPKPVASQPAQPNRGRGNNEAASILMDIYLDSQKRTRSATAAAQRYRLEDDISDQGENGNCTAHSSPIKTVARGHVLAAEIKTCKNGIEQALFSKTQQTVHKPLSSTALLEAKLKTDQSSHQAPCTIDNEFPHRSNFLTTSHDSPTLPVMDNHGSPEKAPSIARGLTNNADRSNGIRYNGKAPVFKPTANFNANVASKDNTQPNEITFNQHQGFVNNSNPAMLSGFIRQTTVGSLAAADTMQVAIIPPSGIHQEPLPNGNFGMGYASPNSASAYGANRQYQQAAGPVTNGQVGHPHFITPGNDFHPDRGQQFNGPYPSTPRQYHPVGNGSPNGPINGGSFGDAKPQNNPSSLSHGYKYGLAGSASDGSISRYYVNEQPNTSTVVARIDHRPINIYPTVGPMEFESSTEEIRNGRSNMLRALTENGRPSLGDLSDPNVFPFIENFKYSCRPEEKGVVVVKNIPYETKRAEVIALLGKTSKILNDREEPVHITMDRVTGKTQDAYCELFSLNAAIELVERFNKKGPENGRTARIGTRVVEVELSSQTSLMATLFPISKCGVKWKGTRPEITMGHKDPWENFKGFFTEEEMVMLSKHIDSPQRSLYARICPERPYECMISTLRKIPWYRADLITLKQRHSVYETCMKMIETLAGKIKRQEREGEPEAEHLRPQPFKRPGHAGESEAERLTPQLFDRLVTSAMLCPGFSVVQKHNIATLACLSEMKCREFNQPRFPDSWTHLWTLVPKADMPIDVLEWYIAVIRAETNRVVQSLDISHRAALQGMMDGLDGYWGFYWAEANFPVGRVWDNMSLADCSRLELRAIDRIITRAVQGGNIPPWYTS
ncbi:hypothetical protein O1611_g6998 [Lasiodiplodia mahajangana]|uniref:Uncharacterized protein n=1 Tax=Lasiodiplodia mahajangana TaxID=1108764 RepID=A0ACC2JGU4_9PEZI|nr:hypothetical protein O1611_g6998 [Lasiodiplodia mahajangana]